MELSRALERVDAAARAGREVEGLRAALLRFLDGDERSDSWLVERIDERLSEGVGESVYLRGLVEFSSRCRKDCYYCGLRRSNTRAGRYTMPFEEIVESIERGYEAGLRSFLLQGGERLGEESIRLVERVFAWMHERWGTEVRSVLSLGELSRVQCERLIAAAGGSARYLLRIEASEVSLYEALHPRDELHSYATRVATLTALRSTGWQVGSGVLIGAPGQGLAHLVSDLIFLLEQDLDMCGMGPFIAHPETPFAESEVGSVERRVELSLRMLALLRLLAPDINIAATTALQTLAADGLERGLACGANVVMPNLTPRKYRERYHLYTGKKSVADRLSELLTQLARSCSASGRVLMLDDPGDPPRYKARVGG